MTLKSLTGWHIHPLLLLSDDITLIIQKYILFVTPTIINSFYSYDKFKELYFKYISLKLGYDVTNVIRLQNKFKKEKLLELMCTNTIRKALLPVYRDYLYDDLIKKFGNPIDSNDTYDTNYKVGDFIIHYQREFVNVDLFLKDYINGRYFHLMIYKIEKILNKTYKVSVFKIDSYIFKSKIDDFKLRKSWEDNVKYDMNTREFVFKYDKRYNIKDLEFILDYKKINIENISIPKINCMNNLLNLTSIDFKFNLLQNINDYIK